VRRLCQLGEAGEEPRLALLHIADGGAYYLSPAGAAVDAAAVRAMLVGRATGTLERLQLSK
jgi:hypothetical protein